MAKKILVERHTIIHTDHTLYRLRPNPDAAGGYENGGVLEWSDDGEEWNDHFFIAPEALRALANALLEASESVEDVEEIG